MRKTKRKEQRELRPVGQEIQKRNKRGDRQGQQHRRNKQAGRSDGSVVEQRRRESSERESHSGLQEGSRGLQELGERATQRHGGLQGAAEREVQQGQGRHGRSVAALRSQRDRPSHPQRRAVRHTRPVALAQNQRVPGPIEKGAGQNEAVVLVRTPADRRRRGPLRGSEGCGRKTGTAERVI